MGYLEARPPCMAVIWGPTGDPHCRQDCGPSSVTFPVECQVGLGSIPEHHLVVQLRLGVERGVEGR